MKNHPLGVLRNVGIRATSLTALVVSVIVPRVVLAVASCTDGTLMGGVCVPSGSSTGLPETSAGQVIVNVMNWLLGILGLIAMIMFVVAGFQYLMAGGEEKNTEAAKGNIKYAIIGVAVALLGYVVVYTVQQLATGSSSATY
ncbi:MAG: pilin [Candidatus Moraniibacteriota bacterium]